MLGTQQGVGDYQLEIYHVGTLSLARPNWSCNMASHLLDIFKTLQNIDWSKWLLRDGCSYHDRSTSMFNTWQKTLWVECILWLSPNRKQRQFIGPYYFYFVQVSCPHTTWCIFFWAGIALKRMERMFLGECHKCVQFFSELSCFFVFLRFPP